MRSITVLALGVCGAVSMAFSTGNLVLVTIGDAGDDTLNQPVALQEYTTAGLPVGSALSLNNIAGRNITTSWGETSEGGLELSANGQYLMATGYDLAPLNNTFSIYDTLRTVARINASGTVQFSASFSLYDPNLLLGDGARNVASLTGDDFMVFGGDAGILKGSFSSGTSTQVFNPAMSSRNGTYRNGLLYFIGSNAYFAPAATSGVNGVTTWDGVIGNDFAKPGVFQSPLTSGSQPGSGRDLFFANDNTIYYSASSGSVGLVKMTKAGGVWSEAYRRAGIGFGSITVDMSGAQPVIYAVGSAGADLFKITDQGTAFSTATSIAVAPASTRFRGVEFAPSSGAATISGSVNLGAYVGTALNSASVNLSYEITTLADVVLSSGTVSVAPVSGVATYSIPAGSASGSVKVRLGGATWIKRSAVTTVGATNANLVLPNGNIAVAGGGEVIDIADYTILAAAFDAVEGGSGYVAAADLNKDTVIDIADYSILAANFDAVEN